MAIKSLSIRIDEEMLNKLHVVADYEGRSANSQILVLIRGCIEKYEAKYGPFNEPVSPDVNVKPPRKG